MNKKEYWAAHVSKNPIFADPDKEIRIKVGSLKKLMDEAFDKGFAHHGGLTNGLKKSFEEIVDDLKSGKGAKKGKRQ